MSQRLLSFTIYGLTMAIGLTAFLYPFWLPALQQTGMASMAHANDAPLMLTLLVGLCFAVLLLEVQSHSISAKSVALLGVLVSINSILRFVDVALPTPGGFSPIFLLIALTGYVYGARFGFLMGALTLIVSAIITGGVGPWLPYQMFTAGWVGMSAPLCRPLVAAVHGQGRWREIVILAAFCGLWGFIFGAVMNIWFWPYATGPVDQYWQPGIGLTATLQRYLVFYVMTSLVWDLTMAAGNVTLLVAFGMPILRALRRFQQRFVFHYAPAPLAGFPDMQPTSPPAVQAGSPLGAAAGGVD